MGFGEGKIPWHRARQEQPGRAAGAVDVEQQPHHVPELPCARRGPESSQSGARPRRGAALVRNGPVPVPVPRAPPPLRGQMSAHRAQGWARRGRPVARRRERSPTAAPARPPRRRATPASRPGEAGLRAAGKGPAAPRAPRPQAARRDRQRSASDGAAGFAAPARSEGNAAQPRLGGCGSPEGAFRCRKTNEQTNERKNERTTATKNKSRRSPTRPPPLQTAPSGPLRGDPAPLGSGAPRSVPSRPQRRPRRRGRAVLRPIRASGALRGRCGERRGSGVRVRGAAPLLAPRPPRGRYLRARAAGCGKGRAGAALAVPRGGRA